MALSNSAGAVDVFIGIGANLDLPRERVEQAIASCRTIAATELIAASSLYRSAPVDSGGGDYLNAVVHARSSLAPLQLLDALLAIENSHGRLRPYRNAPRTLDLDLLLYGGLRIHTARLTLPHPRAHVRAFVLRPLLEIAPDLQIPGIGPAADCLSGVADQRIERLTG